MNQNNLEGYLGGITAPVNPYADKNDPDKRALTYGSEYRQTQGDISMSLYNQQVAEAQLLKQRQWALEDRDYNSPSEIRKRMEEAGFNPALMSGMIATANAPVKGVQGSTSPGKLSDVSGIHNQTMGNIMQAGQNIVSNLVSGKQAELLESNKDLNRAAAIKEMSQAAYTNSSKMRIDQLLNYEADSMKLDIERKQFDLNIEINNRQKMIDVQLDEWWQKNALYQSEIVRNDTLSDVQKMQVKKLVEDIKFTQSQIRYMATQIAIGNEQAAQEVIQTEVDKAAKPAKIAKQYTDIVVDGIEAAVGIKGTFNPEFRPDSPKRTGDVKHTYNSKGKVIGTEERHYNYE